MVLFLCHKPQLNDKFNLEYLNKFINNILIKVL